MSINTAQSAAQDTKHKKKNKKKNYTTNNTTQNAAIQTLDFDTDDGLGQAARIGLIVLQTDQTIEYEFARLFSDEQSALYHARIPNAMEVSPQTLRQMQNDLPRTVALLPQSFGFDAIGYACTSGATMIGEARVDEVIRAVHPEVKTSNPITACKAALSALGLQRIALVTPYAPEVTLEMQSNLRNAGFVTTAVASFNQSDDFTVARITSQSIYNAAVAIGSRDDVEGVFISCTSLRALKVISKIEETLDKPVIASNQALAWHLQRLTGMTEPVPDAGRLFTA